MGVLRLGNGVQMQAYGQCVASKVPAVEQGMCEKEFLALKACIRGAVSLRDLEPSLTMITLRCEESRGNQLNQDLSVSNVLCSIVLM